MFDHFSEDKYGNGLKLSISFEFSKQRKYENSTFDSRQSSFWRYLYVKLVWCFFSYLLTSGWGIEMKFLSVIIPLQLKRESIIFLSIFVMDHCNIDIRNIWEFLCFFRTLTKRHQKCLIVAGQSTTLIWTTGKWIVFKKSSYRTVEHNYICILKCFLDLGVTTFSFRATPFVALRQLTSTWACERLRACRLSRWSTCVSPCIREHRRWR